MIFCVPYFFVFPSTIPPEHTSGIYQRAYTFIDINCPRSPVHKLLLHLQFHQFNSFLSNSTGINLVPVSRNPTASEISTSSIFHIQCSCSPYIECTSVTQCPSPDEYQSSSSYTHTQFSHNPHILNKLFMPDYNLPLLLNK